MGVLFFSSGMIRAEGQLRQIVWEHGQRIEVYRSVKRLSKRFKMMRGDMRVITLLVANQEILKSLLLIRDQMYDLPVTLILPDSYSETMADAHKFYPRFITFIGDDYSDLARVLQKIINRENKMFNMVRGGGYGFDVNEQ